MPSRDGKRLFALGDQPRGRLVRYDAGTKQFVPYLPENPDLSAEGVVLSPDRRSIVYTAFPGGTLWRSAVDGSARVQITFPPMRAVLPRWSPDGSQIAYFAWSPSETPRIYVVPGAGGTPRRVTSGALVETDPSWSPDGRRLTYGSGPGFEAADSPNAVIRIVDLGTGKVDVIPGSQGLFSPRWSPDNRHIAAITYDSTGMRLYDLAARTWSTLVEKGDGSLGWEQWTADGRSLVYQYGPEVRRTTLDDRTTQVIASLQGLDLAYGFLGPWVGFTAEGMPLLSLDVGTHDIYALEWYAP